MDALIKESGGLFGKIVKSSSSKGSEKGYFYTSISTHRVQKVIQFKRGYKHLFYCNLALVENCENYDVATTILMLLIEMAHSSYTKEFSRVSTLGEKMETGERNRDGPLSTARFANPFGVYFDHNGHLFVLDGHSIRLVEMNTEKKLVHTIAGNETQGTNDGKGEDARFQLPVFMSQDPNGDYLVLESHGHQIRKISFNQGLLNEKVVAGKGIECTVSTKFKFGREEKDLSYPHWIGYDRNLQLVCTDTVHNDVCILDLEKRKRKPYSSDPLARFYYPAGCCFNSLGDLFICDYHHHVIKKVPYAKKNEPRTVEIFAGKSLMSGLTDGKGDEALFWNPNGIALDVDDYLIVADAGNNSIRRISPSGVVTTIAGGKRFDTILYADGKGSDARFSTPTNVIVDNHGNIIVADWKNSVLRMIEF